MRARLTSIIAVSDSWSARVGLIGLFGSVVGCIGSRKFRGILKVGLESCQQTLCFEQRLSFLEDASIRVPVVEKAIPLDLIKSWD